jgi:hypothetical protein
VNFENIIEIIFWNRFSHATKKGNGTIEVKTGSSNVASITKAKSGNLLVVRN